MRERVLFLTGRLACPRLEKVLAQVADADLQTAVEDVGVKVAALMTAGLIKRRLAPPVEADRVVVPGLFRGDIDALTVHYNVPFQRGPDDLKDVPDFLGHPGGPPDLSRYDVRIFAEIVEAPTLSVDAIVARAADYRDDGADVIDLGCLPDTPFPHLEDAVGALASAGHAVSVDSADPDELRRGARAGANYLLSLTEDSLALAEEGDATPILIPARPGEVASLLRAMDRMDAMGRPYIADPILDPIHFGFARSVERYAELRRRRPDAEILMGTGNLTELTDADSTGVTAALMGLVSELHITNVLVVQVSAHCRRAVREHDAARRMMYRAREDGGLPSGVDAALLCLRAKKPFVNAPDEIAEMAAAISDPNFRIEVAEDGVHVYNRDGHHVADDPYSLFSRLAVEGDAGHAFYLGYELARAEVAWRLGKRYVQDRPLDWGAAVDRAADDLAAFQAAGVTKRRPGGGEKP